MFLLFFMKCYNSREFMNEEIKTNINWFPGHMKKTIIKIEESLKMVDFVIEVIDSRAPISSQNYYIEQVINKKPILYVLTKKDLCDTSETNKWVNYFNSNGNKAILVNLKTQKDYNLIIDKMMEFCKEKEKKMEKKGLKNVLTKAIIVGIPNVGKSTIINFIAKKCITKVANIPGYTRNVRWVKVNNLMLLDTPGVLQPQFEDRIKGINLGLIGSIKEQVLPIEDLTDYCLNFLKKNHLSDLINKYKLKNVSTNQIILQEIAKNRGFLLKNNELDINKASLILLNEFKNGAICKYTLDKFNLC